MRTLRNIPERAFEVLAFNKGWTATKRGWPDFLCFDKKTKEFIAVEVKPRLNGPETRMKLLKREQGICMDWLKSLGIKCFVSDGVVLEPYSKQKHASEGARHISRRQRRLRAQGVGGAVVVQYPKNAL